jgi:predicted HTH transcriptional regulator
MAFESVKAILDAHDYNALIGLQEDEWLEVKGSTPYNLDSPPGRYELAKDVSAFANASGGIIIAGLQTRTQDTTRIEEIIGFDLCAADAFPVHRYVSLIEEHIHPAIERLNVYWVPVVSDGTLGLGIIEVVPQNPERQYFLIAKAVDGGSKVRQFVFGIVRRNGSSNDPLTIDKLYQYTQKGKAPVQQTLLRMEQRLDTILLNQSRSIEQVDPEEIYNERAGRILDEEGA